ncbi:hypothetical protein BD309DRAFT_963266 [Dichomitus squalens]|uniref:Uncharacterized protein n=1 Tax=Dichomitus squalens TaxID=114155 RepID=A0A4Q9MM45_9APHY|nr:hypothetical protein BD311DRAFT_384127 [Dichomitus squalens]TBU42329.1 hypothetical protein BD309DRAFT_963266 [Dichomitus squalens]
MRSMYHIVGLVLSGSLSLPPRAFWLWLLSLRPPTAPLPFSSTSPLPSSRCLARSAPDGPARFCHRSPALVPPLCCRALHCACSPRADGVRYAHE